MDDIEERLSRLETAVCASPKYKNVTPQLVRSIGRQELGKGRTLKEAVKATRNKLHQIGGAYLDSDPDYSRWLKDLSVALQSGDRENLLNACKSVMRYHSSTRERLGILDRFYKETLSDIFPVRSVLDIACGFNPLAIPWMPLAEGAEYFACDIYQDMMGFLGEFLAMLPVKGHAQALDVIQSCPSYRADVALILKTIPCLERIDKSAGLRLLDTIDSPHLLVSFPSQSLGGRRKGMAVNYEARFSEMLAGRNWSIKRFEFSCELAFLISR